MPCPLCGSSASQELERIPFDRIYEALHAQWQISLTEDVKRSHAPEPETALVRCDDCGLDYFEPAVPGDGEFYAQATSSPRYYNESRWEFQVIADCTRAGSSVIDLGAGHGAFLRSIRTHAGRLVGVDVSPSAVDGLRSAGFEAHQASFGEYAAEHPGEFEVVTGFHIVEHLPDIREFMRAAVELLRPGGQLFFSVPNRERYYRERFEPLDCPPHHLSRWSPAQVDEVSALFGLELQSLHMEPLNRKEFEHLVQARVGRTPRRALKALGLLNPLHRQLTKRAGLLERHGHLGGSMLAELAKQS